MPAGKYEPFSFANDWNFIFEHGKSAKVPNVNFNLYVKVPYKLWVVFL